MITQRDVARAAGVSLPTAQLALNNHRRVSAQTKLKVQAAAKRLGYVPNHAARQLIRVRYGVGANPEISQFGVLSCLDAHKTGPLNPTSLAFLSGVEEGVADRSGVLVYLRQANAEAARRLADLTRAGTVEGWIAFGHVDDRLAASLDTLGCPWVVLGDHACSRPVHQATVDFRQMGRLAVRHLAGLGYRRIGFLGSHMRYVYAGEILAGYREAMRDAGLAVRTEAIMVCELDERLHPWAVECLTRFRRRGGSRAALVCAQPGESAAILSLCSELGIRVPEELGLVFCEMTDSLPFVPGVARVEASAVEAGRSAVALLADIAARKHPPMQRLLVTPRTVPGTSAAKREAKEER
jgi:DNA-binding LacI/PurR family transcriptional regulator